jgi:O-antigen/teichoic acid export membrane protein
VTKSSMAERVTSAMFWNSVLLPVKTALSFVSSVIVVRVLSQSDYAVFTAVIALITTVGLYTDVGIESTILKFIPEIEQRFGRRNLLRFLGSLVAFKFVLIGLILVVLGFIWNAVGAYFHFGTDSFDFLIISAFLLLLGVITDFLLQFLLAYFNQKAANSMDISFAIVQPVLVVFFVWQGWGVPGVLWARVIATALYAVIGFAFSKRMFAQLKRVEEATTNWADITRRFVRLSGVSFFNDLGLYFSDISFVIFVLTFYNDMLGVALFGVAFNRVLAPIRQFLTNALWGIPTPIFARLYVHKDAGKLQEAYASLSRLMTLLLLPAGVGLCMLTSNIIRIFYQSRYEPAAPIAVVLILLLFGESILHPAQIVLVAFEEIPAFFVGRLICLLAIPLLFISIPSYGAIGAAFAIGVPRVASRLYAIAVVRSKFDIHFPWVFLLKVALASGIMAVAMVIPLGLERPHDATEAAIRTALAFLVGSGIFLVIFKLLGSIESTDRERLALLRMPFKSQVLRWL